MSDNALIIGNVMLRCRYTGNPCGTDTRQVGRPCPCDHCRFDSALTRIADERDALRAENAALKAERDKLHAALARLALDDCEGMPLVVDNTTVSVRKWNMATDHDGTGAGIAAALVRLYERATWEEG